MKDSTNLNVSEALLAKSSTAFPHSTNSFSWLPILKSKSLIPFPHQLSALNWVLTRKNSYLALDPGLGKTIVAALVSNETKATIVYVCPPFLVTNTNAEFDKWAIEKKLILVPDSMIAKTAFIRELAKDIKAIKGEKILIVDEAHRFKNADSQRTKALFKIANHFFKDDKIIFMSGTPMPNSRPMELWEVFKRLTPLTFGTNKFSFGKKYCEGKHNGFGWEFNGFTNRTEFKKRLFNNFMLRQKKELLNLPPKIEGLLTVGDNMPPVISKIERKVLEHYTEEDLVEGKILQSTGDVAMHLATYRRLLGEYKLKYVLPYIQNLLEEGENILIFGVHKKTIAELENALQEFKPLVITGDVAKEKRQEIVNQFQQEKDRKVFIGNIAACGVGFTLTKATRVIFVEYSWVDGENQQASDRAHRIGTTGVVQVQYVVLKDSFDAKLMGTLLNKREKSL